MRILAEQGDATSDATAIQSARFAILEDTILKLQVHVVAKGNNGGRAAFVRDAVVSRDGSNAPTLDASNALGTFKNLAAATWTISLAFDNNDLVINIQGQAGVTVIWQCEIDGMYT